MNSLIRRLLRASTGARVRSLLGGCGLLAASAVQAAGFTLSVVDGDGNPVSGFKYTVQKDTTFAVDPAIPADARRDADFRLSRQQPPASADDRWSQRQRQQRWKLRADHGSGHRPLLRLGPALLGLQLERRAGHLGRRFGLRCDGHRRGSSDPDRPDRHPAIRGLQLAQQCARRPGGGGQRGRLAPVHRRPRGARGALRRQRRALAPGRIRQPPGHRLPAAGLRLRRR